MAQTPYWQLNDPAYRKLKKFIRDRKQDYQNRARHLVPNGSGRQAVVSGGELPIKWKNANSSSCPPFGVIRIVSFDTDSDTFSGDQPNTTLQRLYLVNGPRTVAYNGFGRATWLISPKQQPAWSTVAYDNTDGTPAIGEEWGPVPSQWTVRKYRPGLLMLGVEDSTSYHAKAVQSITHSLLGKTDASHAKGASGTVSVWVGTAGSETDSTINVTAYNRFAAVASGKWVHLTATNGQWYLDAAEC